MKVIITRAELLNLLEQNKEAASSCNHSDYFSWNNGWPELVRYLSKVAEINNPNCGTQTNYWGENVAVELDKYPYCRCEIHRCKKCRKLFFFYVELGGHGTQDRYRLIRRELL